MKYDFQWHRSTGEPEDSHPQAHIMYSKHEKPYLDKVDKN